MQCRGAIKFQFSSESTPSWGLPLPAAKKACLSAGEYSNCTLRGQSVFNNKRTRSFSISLVLILEMLRKLFPDDWCNTRSEPRVNNTYIYCVLNKNAGTRLILDQLTSKKSIHRTCEIRETRHKTLTDVMAIDTLHTSYVEAKIS